MIQKCLVMLQKQMAGISEGRYSGVKKQKACGLKYTLTNFSQR